MAPVFGRNCAAHRLPIALVLDLESSGSEKCMFMMLSAHLQQLSQHVDNVVPQPEHSSQFDARPVDRRAHHGAGAEPRGWTFHAVASADTCDEGPAGQQRLRERQRDARCGARGPTTAP